jgi:hypothetical protein
MQRRTVMSALAGSAGLVALGRPALAQAAWTPLFNGRDFEGWDRIGDANWRVEDGALVADRGNGFLVTRGDHGDFELRTEFWADAHTNSGIYIRCTVPANVSTANSYEVNIWDERPEPRYGTGAIVDLAPVNPMPRAGGRWNTLDITARGDSLSVVLNGQRTVDGVRDQRYRSGRIALQRGLGARDAQGVPNPVGVVRFRRVEIMPL